MLDNIGDKHCLALLFICNFILWATLGIEHSGLILTFNNLNLAEVFGIFTITLSLTRLGPEDFFSRRDYLFLSAAALLILYPRDPSVFLSLTLVGLLLRGRPNKDLASIGELSLGLAWVLFWGKLVFQFIQPWLLPIEAWIGFLPLSFFGSFTLSGNAIHPPDGHGGVIIGPPCSAFNNTIKTAFIWLCLIKLFDLPFRIWQIYGLMVSLVIVVALNTVRLALMAYSERGYSFWHNGAGAPIIAYSMLTLVLLTFYLFQSKSKST